MVSIRFEQRMKTQLSVFLDRLQTVRGTLACICKGSANVSHNESFTVLIMCLTVMTFVSTNGKELFFSALFKLYYAFF